MVLDEFREILRGSAARISLILVKVQCNDILYLSIDPLIYLHKYFRIWFRICIDVQSGSLESMTP